MDADDIDVVSVVVSNALHRQVAEDLVRAGKHVLCEKPLSDSLENARAMAELEARHRRRLQLPTPPLSRCNSRTGATRPSR
ncbi:hypothetical protein HMPREF9597_01016 [Cutibacterium acnes HL005PA4]|nr:hypothetical protein HMPREF9597_01016 [Cutibacterium acnes HL005PA4]EFT13571.1 hypothetical protein HMPREF9620_00357 [Cutibacterium acnes HL037PA1]